MDALEHDGFSDHSKAVVFTLKPNLTEFLFELVEFRIHLPERRDTMCCLIDEPVRRGELNAEITQAVLKLSLHPPGCAGQSVFPAKGQPVSHSLKILKICAHS